jgi:NAD(P)-dependent dehydrogenase (short-subunit alcohol dehydrogenase family)
VGELQDIGFAGVERRVRTLAGIDVADMKSLKHAVDETVRAFGRIDYLINNAGVSGAEEMAVDMGVENFRHTQFANLISNYALMHMVVPMMRKQGSGYILNVSSYFGGEKYLAVSYPNRTDYAVSKSGQRAMVESMARHLGPEIQINAIAPGPVDGDRLGVLACRCERLGLVHRALVRTRDFDLRACDAAAFGRVEALLELREAFGERRVFGELLGDLLQLRPRVRNLAPPQVAFGLTLQGAALFGAHR